MFSRSSHFTISGGTFNSIARYISTLAHPSDCRRIPLGDIDLQREIYVKDGSRIVYPCRRKQGLRRVYSARVHESPSNFTAVVYEGEDAEKTWNEDVARYTSIRHPNVLQIFATAQTGNIHATIFHGDIIPFKHFIELYRQFPLLTVYIYASIITEFKAVENYFVSTFGCSLYDLQAMLLTRRSTGRLCTDILASEASAYIYDAQPMLSDFEEIPSMINDSTQQSKIPESLSLTHYHEICHWYLGRSRFDWLPTRQAVNFGAILRWPLDQSLENATEIASLPSSTDFDFDMRWSWLGCTIQNISYTMANGWIRISSKNALNKAETQAFSLNWQYENVWLTQANHIFAQGGITSNLHEYAVLDSVRFWLKIDPSRINPPQGYLFLCPAQHFHRGDPCHSFAWPECPAYWSLDPLGMDRLDEPSAAALGFPNLKFSTATWWRSWDGSVYTGLRQFHEGKGFDAESEEVALHLGQPLYELSAGDLDDEYVYVEVEHLGK
ncbi:hypothetical protein R3P38DRAFT_3037830 [Favolaschia claudopus]|uniref:Peptidase M1 membrane alanine aminopeptidase domain-containing protein n=1 Tax=Favolaschia claudopus TaxID=2862362 RepID=A0AAW0ABQ2_9AGAR